MTLLEHVRAQLDSQSLGHLSPSIVTPNYLKGILIRIQTELPHHLWLPLDPTEELWRYYNVLGCVTLMENDKLLILMSVPLLDRDSMFEIYQVINLPIPYPRTDQKMGAVARYRLEIKYIALNLARSKFMMLPEEEASKCKADALRICTSASPIYVTGNYNLCALELFKGDKGGIRRNCQVEFLADVVSPQAISISDGVWAVTTQREIDLSMVCDGKTTRTIKVIPPPVNNGRITIRLFRIWNVDVSSPLLSGWGKIWKEEVLLKINWEQLSDWCTRRRKTTLSNFSKLLSSSMMYVFTKCVEYNGEEKKKTVLRTYSFVRKCDRSNRCKGGNYCPWVS